jgi:prepilin-type N-terminal cleavage/methylation domain-containing protein
MRRFRRFHKSTRGFTLIEVIVTLVVAAILGTILVVYMSGGITKSGIPIIWVQQEFGVYRAMERITAVYQNDLKTTPFSLATFSAKIDTPGEVNTICGSNTCIDNVSVVNTAFPAAGGTENGTDTNIVKVTLRKGDQSLTALFTQ